MAFREEQIPGGERGHEEGGCDERVLLQPSVQAFQSDGEAYGQQGEDSAEAPRPKARARPPVGARVSHIHEGQDDPGAQGETPAETPDGKQARYRKVEQRRPGEQTRLRRELVLHQLGNLFDVDDQVRLAARLPKLDDDVRPACENLGPVTFGR